MKKILITTTSKKMLADVYTPVGIYLRLRDKFRDTILLESTDNHAAENSYSFIGINAIAGIEISSTKSFEFKLPNQQSRKSSHQSTKCSARFDCGTLCNDLQLSSFGEVGGGARSFCTRFVWIFYLRCSSIF
ncbi:MAG: hypothetical protein V9E96_09925 [Chitinophagaceae bacterium]